MLELCFQNEKSNGGKILEEVTVNNFGKKADEKIYQNMEKYATFIVKTKRFIRRVKFNIINIINKKRKNGYN